MSAYNETKSQNDVIYSTPQKNLTKVQSKINAAYAAPPKQDHYASTNNTAGIYPSSSRAISNDLEVQNYYRHVKNSHEVTNTSHTKANSFFDMLQDYQPAVLGVIGTHQRSPGPAEFMLDKDIQCSSNPPNNNPNKDSHCNTIQQTDSSTTNKITRDIKVKNKIHRFLVQPKPKTDDNAVLGLSVLTKNCQITEELAKPTPCFSSTTKRTVLSPEEIQEQQRQRIFGHYDCQSLVANMNYVKISKKLSAKPFHSILPELKNSTPDFNYGNELLKSCLLFCNEIGGENDGRFSSKKSSIIDQNGFVCQRHPRRSITPCSVSILESLPNETLWRVGVCPFQNDSCSIEYVDHGAHYYKRFFYTQKHENWFGIDENFGPMAISIKKEQVTETNFVFRVIVRNSELLTMRGFIVEESIISSRASGKSVSSKELLEYIAPDIQLGCLRLGLSTPKTEQQLLKLDEQGLQSKYKVGILYCRSGQSSEEDMYNNEHAGPAFTEFLDIIGKRVRLKGFQQYKAGLDNKSDSTGTHSVYAFYKNCEIMFHVCTMLPFTPNNRQQLLRKRHIGNDIVTIVFQEPGALPFDPNSIRSQFQHVFVIVRVINPCSSNTTYRVAITRSKEVPSFGPPLPASALFSRNKLFAEFILAKTINAENASHRSDKFANLAIRTRREYLKDLCLNHSTNTLIDPGNKFSIFPNRKKEKAKIQFCTNPAQRGAICWRILLQNHGFDVETECWVGISTETLVIIEESSRNVVFATPTRSILGWSTCDNSFRIFYHNGECISFTMFFSTGAGAGALDEQLQIVERLEAVTLGNGALELNMRRNMMGQLGFHVQPDGIVTQVDANGQAWAAGMRRGYRLVEVCKIVVATLSYAELIDLLKTSAQMNAIVIKAVSDGSPRQGCFNKNCKTNILSQEFLHSLSNKFLLEKDGYRVKNVLRKEIDHQYSGLNFTSGPYEQRSLPHKSKNNSCYSTPSSCFSSSSLGDEYKKAVQQFNSNTPCSLKNDKWFETFKEQDQRKLTAYAVTSQTELDHSHSSTSSDGAKVQTWLQNGTSAFPQTDVRKLQQRRSPEYEGLAFKNATFYPNINYHLEKEVPTSHTMSPGHTNKITDSRTGLKSKNSFHEVTAFPSTSVIKTAKVGTVVNDFSPSSMKSVQQRKTNYPRTKEFRPDLLEVAGSNSNSYTDSLKANSIRMAEREKALSFIADSSKIHDKYQDYDISNDERFKKHPNLVSSASCSSPRRRQPGVGDLETNGLPIGPPLLPYSKELDWTTLVDTATKAIILQHRDDNS